MADVVAHWYGGGPKSWRTSISIWRWRAGGLLLVRSLHRQRRSGARRFAAHLLHRLGRASDDKFTAVCLVPRGAEEGVAVEIDNDALQLVANRPVSFRLYSSLTRTEDRLGDVVEFPAGGPELHTHAPLNAVIRFGRKAEERLIPVKLGARLTEIGTLETWCESKISDNRWRLQFELRKTAARSAPAERKAARR